MQWPTIEELTERAPLPTGYRYAYLTRAEIPQLIDSLKVWYPGIAVGNARLIVVPRYTIERVTPGASYCFPPQLGKARIYLGAAAEEDERSNKRLRSH